jgi:hypothetical protein
MATYLRLLCEANLQTVNGGIHYDSMIQEAGSSLLPLRFSASFQRIPLPQRHILSRQAAAARGDDGARLMQKTKTDGRFAPDIRGKAMDQEFFDSFYKDRYEKLAESFDRRGNNKYRYVTRLYQVTLLASSAITPVIIALSDSNHLKILAITLSSLVAILSGLGRIFRPEDAWMNARTTRNALWREATYYHAGLSDYASSEDRRVLFVERITSIIDRYNVSQSARIQESFKEPAPRARKADVHNS